MIPLKLYISPAIWSGIFDLSVHSTDFSALSGARTNANIESSCSSIKLSLNAANAAPPGSMSLGRKVAKSVSERMNALYAAEFIPPSLGSKTRIFMMRIPCVIAATACADSCRQTVANCLSSLELKA